MESAIPLRGEPAPAPLFATFVVRVSALAFDAMLIVCGYALAVVLVVITNSPSAGRVAVAILFAELVLYEPIMVTLFGGTFGHRRYNLRVVDDATGDKPGLARSVLRFVLKTVLGIPSFTSMFLTRRHQAVHDRLSRTTVQVRDMSRLDPDAFVSERDPHEMVVRVSPWRRLLVIGVYLCVLFVAISVASTVAISDSCMLSRRCSTLESATMQLLGVALIAAAIWCVVAGWRGRLPGARTQAPTD